MYYISRSPWNSRALIYDKSRCTVSSSMRRALIISLRSITLVIICLRTIWSAWQPPSCAPAIASSLADCFTDVNGSTHGVQSIASNSTPEDWSDMVRQSRWSAQIDGLVAEVSARVQKSSSPCRSSLILSSGVTLNYRCVTTYCAPLARATHTCAVSSLKRWRFRVVTSLFAL